MKYFYIPFAITIIWNGFWFFVNLIIGIHSKITGQMEDFYMREGNRVVHYGLQLVVCLLLMILLYFLLR